MATGTKTTDIGDICGLEWMRQQTWPVSAATPSKTVVLADLFCGCGGLSLGVWEALRVAGYETDITLALDNAAQALRVYSDNFGLDEGVAVACDIETILPGSISDSVSESERQVEQAYGGLDMLVAGPPCQGHSDLNNSTRRDDPRNELYLKVARFAELTRPRIVVIENVPSAIHDKSGVVNRSKDALSALGYVTKSIIVNTLHLGLPQTRKRHVLVAVRDQSFGAEDFALDAQEPSTLDAYIGDIMDECLVDADLYHTPSGMRADNRRRASYLFEHGLFDLPDTERPDCHRKKPHTYRSMYGRLQWDRPAQTITSGFGSMGQGRFLHPERQRTLTPHESARIQGFPDFFDFSSVVHRTRLHEMIGNAVPPRASALITQKLIECGIL